MGTGIPQTHRAVLPTRGGHGSVGAERDAGDEAGMTPERHQRVLETRKYRDHGIARFDRSIRAVGLETEQRGDIRVRVELEQRLRRQTA
jgi:hypothetical protein